MNYYISRLCVILIFNQIDKCGTKCWTQFLVNYSLSALAFNTRFYNSQSIDTHHKP